MAEFLSVLFIGITVGSIYALASTGLVLTYRISGVFNFAQGAIGMFFAYVFFQLNQGGVMNFAIGKYNQTWTLPAAIALILVVGLAAPALGWGLDKVLFRKIRDAGNVVKIVATIGILIAFQGLAPLIWGSSSRLTPHPIFPTHVFEIGGFRAPFPSVATIMVAVGLAAALLGFLRFSPLGIRMRAVVDRPDVAELMGVDSKKVSGLAWGIGTGFAALAGILLAPFYGSLDPLTLTFLVVIATAAAVVGRLESIPITFAGAMAIGMVQQLVQRYVTDTTLSSQLQSSIPFVILFVALLLPISWPAAPDKPPRAPRAPSGPVSPEGKALRLGLIVLILIVPALAATPDWQSRIATVPPMAIIFLSLVLLSGYAGQVSLAQGAFAGFGAFLAAHLVADHGWPFFLAVPVAALFTIPLGAVLASRAARLPPLFLGFATLAFGSLMDQMAFNSQSFSGGLGGVFFNRPGFVRSSLSYYFATLIIFGIFALLVTNIRRGKTGLALTAMRDSQVAVASTGASVTRLKFVAFCVSAFIAAFGGALFAGAQNLAQPVNFLELQSLLFLALAVIGGINRWTGALIGATLFLLAQPAVQLPAVQNSFIGKDLFNGQLPELLPILFGLGAIGLAQNPHGVVEQVREGFLQFRDRVQDLMGGRKETAPARAQGESVASWNGAAVTFPSATLYHQPDCVLTVGKDGAEPVTGANGQGLGPCPVCRPEPVAASVPPPPSPPGTGASFTP